MNKCGAVLKLANNIGERPSARARSNDTAFLVTVNALLANLGVSAISLFTIVLPSHFYSLRQA